MKSRRRLGEKLLEMVPGRDSERPSGDLIGEMSQALAGIVTARELAEALVGRLADASGIREAALLLPADDGALGLVEARGWGLDAGKPPRLGSRGAVAGHLLQACRPATADELTVALSPAQLTQDERWWLSRPEARLWIPLVRRTAHGRYILGKLQGVLLFGTSGADAPSPRELRRALQTLSWGAAVAAENVALLDVLRRRAEEVNRLYSEVLASRENERKRIARELHDRVIQDLVDLLYTLETPKDGQASREGRVRARVREIIDTLRSLCSELRPSALDDLNLSLALRGYVEEAKEKYGLPVRLEIPDGEDERLESLSEERRLCLVRVLQESLTNVHRHAGARSVQVRLRTDHEHLVLEIRDDGRGFECPMRLGALVREGRFGLAGAQERVLSAGGVLEVESTRGMGTRIQLRFPWKEAQASASLTESY